MSIEHDPPDAFDNDLPRRRRPESSHELNAVRTLLLLAFGAILAAAAIWGWNLFRLNNRAPLTNPEAKLREPAPKEALDADESEAVNLFKKVRPSVVNVDIVQVERVGWDARPTEQQTAAGSGFIWDDDGHIVTNYHVIADVLRRPSFTPRIVLADRSAHDGVIVGASPDYDLAVLQFAPQDRPSKDQIKKIDLGTSHDLEVGQKVFAIGNPYGLSLTMTKGIISALDRSIESPSGATIAGVIQVDAAINPGNSGGPLLDKSGRLIGVNTAISTPTPHGGNVGIGFAIPSDLVNQVVTQIIQSGHVLKPDLGVKLYDQQKLRRARFDHGVMIESTTPNGPADKAGLQGVRLNQRTGRLEPGDIIVAINGETVDSVEDYERIVRKLKPGDEAKLKIVRKDAEQEVTVKVGGA